MYAEQVYDIAKTKELILSFFSKESPYYTILFSKAFEFADNGPHKDNHYHNTYHHYAVAKMCVIYMTHNFTGVPRKAYGEPIDIVDQAAIFIAALLHDYSHSGKSIKLIPDSINIANAISGLDKLEKSLTDKMEFHGFGAAFFRQTYSQIFELAEAAIRSTEVSIDENGKLSFQDVTSYLTGILRDSDVTAAMNEYSIKEVMRQGALFSPGVYYSFIKAQEVSRGLAMEMGVPFNEDFEDRNLEFYSSVKLHTIAAERYREVELDWIKKTHVKGVTFDNGILQSNVS